MQRSVRNLASINTDLSLGKTDSVNEVLQQYAQYLDLLKLCQKEVCNKSRD